jgi:enediyne polyketide synthase
MKPKESCQIAVIGIGCRYPGATSPLELWENILSRRQQFRQIPDVRLPLSEYYDPDPSVPDKIYQSKAALIDGYEFNWLEKRIPKKAFESTDIVHWLTLDVALEAMRDAGYVKGKLPNQATGVIIGNTLTGEITRSNQMPLRWPYVKKVLKASLENKGLEHHFDDIELTMEKYYKSVFAPVTEDTLAGGLANTIAGRVCNYLDLHGGGYIVDGACSSSLIAICTAANHLESGQMDMVIAGGVDISLDTFELIGFSKTGALTKDEMRVYDKLGKGFLPGEGCGIVILKRLEDAVRDNDQIYSIINGWGISSDGKGGITAPSSVGQSTALKRAYSKANFDTHYLDFIEGHGTGTTVGDKTELEGIALALNYEKELPARSCGVTSFKSIVGHTKAAAGVGAFIKTAISLNRRILPPTAGLKEANPIFEGSAKAVYPIVHGEIRDPLNTLHAGVSAMGFGGINSHVLLQSGNAPYSKLQPNLPERKLLVSNQNSEVFFFWAENKGALLENIDKLIEKAKGMSYAEMVDLASENNNRVNFSQPYRAAVVAGSPNELERKLEVLKAQLVMENISQFPTNENESIVFGKKIDNLKIGALYPGQGSQRINMTQKLIERFDWAQDLLEQACAIFGSNKIKDTIFKPVDRATDDVERKKWNDELKQTEVAQPAIILANLIWNTYLEKLGINFNAVTGHSLGELMTFYAAGFYSQETLLRFAAFRGQVMSESSSGSMASLLCNKEKAEEYLKKTPGYLTIANINSLQQTVISGEAESIKHLIELAKQDQITAIQLPVSAAFHSKLVLKASQAISDYAELKTALTKNTHLKAISSTSGSEIMPGIALNDYFAEQAISQVDFVSAIANIQQACDVLVEVGPGKVLTGLAANANKPLNCFPVEAFVDDDFPFNVMLANLFVRGANLNVQEIYKDRLVRNFTPASQKEFIVNPLERPFPAELALETSLQVSTKPKEVIGSDVIFNSLNIPYVDLESYLQERGDFIKDIILTDMKYLGGLGERKAKKPAIYQNGKPTVSKVFSLSEFTPYQNGEVKPAMLVEKPQPVAVTANTTEAIAETVYNLVADKTGFPKDQLEGNLRLLNDLNLDSIKAGSLLAELLKKYNLQGEIEASAYANASLGEIIHILSEHVLEEPILVPTAQTTANSRNSIQEKVIGLVAEKTGFPAEMIQPDFRLLNDLNLDSIKAGSLIAQLAKEFNLQEQFEASGYANASLEEITDKIHSSLSTQAPVAAVIKSAPQIKNVTKEQSDWVSSFSVAIIHEPLELAVSKSRQEQRIGLIYADNNRDAAFGLAELLGENTNPVQLIHHSELQTFKDLLNRLLVLVPETTTQKAVLRETVEMFANVAQFTSDRNIEIGFIQFGDGYFSRCNLVPHKECSALSGVAFAASIHLERPKSKIRVIEFAHEIAADIFAEKLQTEFNTDDAYYAVGYDRDAKRSKMIYDLAKPASPRQKVGFSQQDVVLVTGGGKGITAECALALAEKYHCKMALVGSSALSDEVQQTLKRYAAKNLSAKYYSCDITELEPVQNLIAQITNELGPITGVVHGAGINKPRRAEHVSAEEAYKEIAPKLLGAWNLIESLKTTKLKNFIALTSIIGITGMPGNSWYAFSNESLDLLMRNLKKQFGTETLSLAYSVWSEVGMGARMGSTKTLASMGIGAIAPDKGIEEFMHWLENCTDDQQVVISARLGGLDTWKRRQVKSPTANRYLEEVIYLEPGIEAIVRVSLQRKHDKYTDDHNFNGSLLFPTVFGLEAMTQVAALLSGLAQPDSICFENVSLLRPIVVPEEGEMKIQIQASRQEGEKIFVSISTEESNYTTAHFSTEITFNHSKEKPTTIFNIPQEEPLKIEPETDLYTWLLFQGPIYQNIQNIYTLNSGSVLLSTKSFSTDTSEICFSEEKQAPFIMGSPLLRDVLLQSAQLVLTENVYLPIGIKKWEIFNTAGTKNKGYLSCELVDKQAQVGIFDVTFAGEQNQVFEKITGYEVKALKPSADYPKPAEIADIEAIERRIQKGFQEFQSFFKQEVDPVIYKHSSVFNKLDQKSRHEIEQRVFTQKYATDNLLQNALILWSPSGKPEIANSDLNISISHSRSILLITVGKEVQGCDIEFIENRHTEDWISLLGQQNANLLNELEKVDHDFDRQATRIWCVKETIIKAYGSLPKNLQIEQIAGKGVIFSGLVSNNIDFKVLTFPVDIWPGNQVIVASLLPTVSISLKAQPAAIKSKTIHKKSNIQFDEESGKFVHQFPTTFKDCKSFHGKTYFTNFPVWMGQLRELALSPISSNLMSDFRTNEFGMVTNTSSVKIYNEAEALDDVIGQIWITDKSNFASSYIDLNFEWLKKEDDGSLTKLAECNLSTTWVTIEGHGIVKQSPIPPYFLDFLHDHLGTSSQAFNESVQPYLSLDDLGELKYESVAKPRPTLLLHKKIYQTGIFDGNSVGNLYYSNYYDWQAKTLEQFVYSLAPEVFTQQGKAGEFISLEAVVNHLQEAMPFEEIEVNMYLEKLHENGFKLYFEYYSLSNGQKRKLAYGHNIILWAKRADAHLKPTAVKLPQKIQSYFAPYTNSHNSINEVNKKFVSN